MTLWPLFLLRRRRASATSLAARAAAASQAELDAKRAIVAELHLAETRRHIDAIWAKAEARIAAARLEPQQKVLGRRRKWRER